MYMCLYEWMYTSPLPSRSHSKPHNSRKPETTEESKATKTSTSPKPKGNGDFYRQIVVIRLSDLTEKKMDEITDEVCSCVYIIICVCVCVCVCVLSMHVYVSIIVN